MRNMKFFERRHDEYRDFSCTAAEYDFWEGEMARVKAGVEPWRDEEATRRLASGGQAPLYSYSKQLINLGKTRSILATDQSWQDSKKQTEPTVDDTYATGLFYFTIFAVTLWWYI